jgi:hypothetical protein
MRHALRFALLLATGITLAATPAVAQSPAPDDGATRLDVRVGQTIVVDVAYARGIRCDDLTVLTPELRPHDFSSNWFYVTGLRPGTTLCRAGVEDDFPTYLFRITVRR